MMKRREFITLLVGGAATWPHVARAQQSGRMRRIGLLMTTAADDPEGQARIAALLQTLQPLGWTVGRNVGIDYRWSAGDAANTRKYAAELVLATPISLSPHRSIAPSMQGVQGHPPPTRQVARAFYYKSLGDGAGSRVRSEAQITQGAGSRKRPDRWGWLADGRDLPRRTGLGRVVTN